jgi:hypothetical protein
MRIFSYLRGSFIIPLVQIRSSQKGELGIWEIGEPFPPEKER